METDGAAPAGSRRSIFDDEIVWQLTLAMTDYFDELFAQMQTTQRKKLTDRKWQELMTGIQRWDAATLAEEVTHLRAAMPRLDVAYRYAALLYLRNMLRGKGKVKVKVPPFEAFLSAAAASMASRRDVRNRRYLDYGPTDKQTVATQVVRSGLAAASADQLPGTPARSTFELGGGGGGAAAPAPPPPAPAASLPGEQQPAPSLVLPEDSVSCAARQPAFPPSEAALTESLLKLHLRTVAKGAAPAAPPPSRPAAQQNEGGRPAPRPPRSGAP